VNEKSNHLSEEQFNSLLDAQSTAMGGATTPSAVSESRRHLDVCGDCQRLFHRYEQFSRQLFALKDTSGAQAEGECPTEADLRRLALNMPSAETEQFMNHVMNCDSCNTKLREAVEDLVAEPNLSEELALKDLQSSKSEWQHHLAHRLAEARLREVGTIDKHPRSISGGNSRLTLALRALLAIAALLLIVFSGTGLYLLLHKPSLEQLLTSAYSERRTLDFRILGASYAEMGVKRGDGATAWKRPASLLEAEIRLERDFPKHANDPAWLAAKGRASLLNNDFDDAIQNLNASLAISPTSLSTRIDLASAYSERARTKGQPWDNAEAVEILMNVLHEQPQNQVAIFNLALILDRQSLVHQAAEQWRNYLKIDPNGGWANEARKNLQQDDEEIRKLNRQLPLLDGPQIAAEKLDQTSAIVEALDERAEDYLREATVRWLPQAFPLRSTSHLAADYRSALRILAVVLQEHHRDTWLLDLLIHTDAPEFALGISSLAQSISANEAGDYEQGAKAAHLAAAQFLHAKNPAGNLRSRLEEVYSARLSNAAARCNRLGASLADEVAHTDYAWTTVQTTLERQECLNMQGELGQALSLSNANLASAQSARYPQLYLRAVLFAADTEASLGNVRSSWRRTSDGLASSWQSANSRMRTYSLDTELDFLADQTGRTRFDEIVLKEALATLSTDRDVLLRAMANDRLAQVAFAADDLKTAAEHFQTALDLFSVAPPTSVTANHRMESEIGLARVEFQQKRFAAAAHRLAEMQSAMQKISNRYLRIDFLQTLGEADLNLNQTLDGETAICSALELTETALDTLHSDNDRLEWDHAAGKTYRTLVELKLQEHDIIGALEYWEWYRGATIRRPQPTSARHALVKTRVRNDSAESCPGRSLHVVQDQLSSLSGTIVISYAVLPRGIAAWAYDNRGVRFHWISREPAVVSQLVDRFTALCSEPTSDRPTLLQLGRALYDQLLAPFGENLAADPIIILEPDSTLWSTPFPALVRPDGNYLSDSNSLSEVPGLYYRSLIRTRHAIESTDEALVVSEDVAIHFQDTDLPALPSALTEVRFIADQFRHAILLRNQEATAEAISKSLREAVVFHFAGHAIQTSDGAALLLATPTKASDLRSNLGVATLGSMHFPHLQLAVLSACSTERGVDGNGLLDSGSLARAFIRRGVSHVIASRWPVDSAATEETMASFYANLFHGVSPSEALRLAMINVRIQRSTSHPYYWAAFASFGWT